MVQINTAAILVVEKFRFSFGMHKDLYHPRDNLVFFLSIFCYMINFPGKMQTTMQSMTVDTHYLRLVSFGRNCRSKVILDDVMYSLDRHMYTLSLGCIHNIHDQMENGLFQMKNGLFLLL